MKRTGWIALIVGVVVITGGIIWAVGSRGTSDREGPKTAKVARRALSVGIEALGAVQQLRRQRRVAEFGLEVDQLAHVVDLALAQDHPMVAIYL